MGLSSSEVFDFATPSRCLRKTMICGHESRLNSLGQGHIGRVIRCEIWMQLPYPSQQWPMADSFKIEVGKVRKRHGGSAFIEHAGEQSLPYNCDHLKVEQFRRDETFTSKTFTGTVAVLVIVRERRCDHRRVNDDQLGSRSSRTASLAKRNDTWPPLR